MQKINSLKISPQRLLLLNSDFGEKEADNIVSRLFDLDMNAKENIFLQINCKGGSYVGGIKIYDAIQVCKSYVNVTGIVTGDAFSMAAIVLQACSYRVASSNSRLLFHNAYREIRLKIEADSKVESFKTHLQEEIDNLSKKNDVIKNIIKGKILSEVDLDIFLKEDRILSPKEALKMNLIDKII